MSLDRVRHLLAVSSCKGGVGKSTVAVNLACALRAAGRTVGLFDADVHGPSLPTMIDAGPDFAGLRQGADGIEPVRARGLALMSFGWVPQQDGGEGRAAIMRGPMVSGVVNQLLTETAWGALDILVIDLPPGTGDIQLTLAQIAKLSGAVIVSTPQKLAYVDVEKGVEMFARLSIPSLALVENMSWFRCGACGEQQPLFGSGAGDRLAEQLGLDLVKLPLVPEVAAHGDSGTPFFDANADHEVGGVYQRLATKVWDALEQLANDKTPAPSLEYNVGQDMILKFEGREFEFPPADLRRACRCAHCVNEMTGQPVLDPAQVPEEIYPTNISPMGNYAVAVEWSETVAGCARSIFPYEFLRARYAAD